MKPESIEPFEMISFKRCLRLLESECSFIMIYKGTDDLNDTYASILLDNPDIAKGFVFPNGHHALLIEKTTKSKDLLVDYIIELGHPNIDYETIQNWDDLIVLIFDGDYHIIELTANKENRIQTVKKIKKKYKLMIESLKL